MIRRFNKDDILKIVELEKSTLNTSLGALMLNESLNNIRIVTGQSTDQMAKFAEEANKSAKALSTKTTDYTDAALIYYQQGKVDLLLV